MGKKLHKNDFWFLASPPPSAIVSLALLAKLDLILAQLSPSLFWIIFHVQCLINNFEPLFSITLKDDFSANFI